MELDNRNHDPLFEMFLFETGQLIEQMEELLLDIEKARQLTEAGIHEIFRIMHTIKGSSAMMGYDAISNLAHALEDLFDLFRTQPEKIPECVRLTDLMLQAVDALKAEIVKIEAGENSEGQTDGLIATIKQFYEEILASDGAQSESEAAQTPYYAHVHFDAACQMENLRAFTLVHNLTPYVTQLTCIPEQIEDDESTAETIRENGFKVFFSSDETQELLLSVIEQTMFVDRFDFGPFHPADANSLFVETNSSFGIMVPLAQGELDLFKKEGNESDKLANPQEKSAANTHNIISVNIKKLDQLMDLVGELVISEAMVINNPDLNGLQLDSFQKAARQLKKLTDELQDQVMSMRMIPVTGTFNKMQRIVRDMNHKLGKDVDLQLSGEDTEMDKSIIDSLADPLMHLIRNAVDHGIETAAERLEAGKSERGLLKLEARNAGGEIWITLKDDGRGLNRDKILEKARELNFLQKPEQDYSDKEIFAFILLPGFSTKEQVSEFSGRGVGMDVVREAISRIGGQINLDSVAGQGTTIHIRIPLTLAIINGMQISVGKSNYIIPITSIRESFRINSQKVIVDPEGNEMIMIRGECCNVIRIHRLYQIKPETEVLEEGIVIVVEDNNQPFCLFADQLVGEQQVVIKPLPNYIKKTQGLSGCTILGDGSISLILDVAGMAVS